MLIQIHSALELGIILVVRVELGYLHYAARCVLDKVFTPHPAIRRDDIIYTPPGV